MSELQNKNNVKQAQQDHLAKTLSAQMKQSLKEYGFVDNIKKPFSQVCDAVKQAVQEKNIKMTIKEIECLCNIKFMKLINLWLQNFLIKLS